MLQSWLKEIGDAQDSIKKREGHGLEQEKQESVSRPFVTSTNENDEELISPEESKNKRRNEEEGMQSLAFPEMGLREVNIDKAAKDTCQWLFDNPDFQV